MKKLKKIVALLGVAAMSLGVVGCSSASDATDSGYGHYQGDIARVGDVVITSDDVAEELVYVEQLLIMQFGEKFYEDEFAYSLYLQQEEMVINYLIETQLVLQDAVNQGIEISEVDIDAEVEEVMVGIGGQDAFDAALEMQGMTEEEFRDYVRESLLIQGVAESVIADVTVEDQEVIDYYEEYKDLFIRPAGADMAHILVETEEEAQQVKAEYEAGETFEDLAAKYGTDGTAATGGSLGGFISYTSAQYDPDFLAGAVGLEEGEVSDPVETQFGYHLIKVTNVQAEDEQIAFEELEEEIRIQLQEEKEYIAFNEYIQDLGENADIEIFYE